MTDDEFELVSHEEIAELRREVEKIKKNPLGDTSSSINLLDSMNDLTRAINNILSIFENTEKELLNEYSKSKSDYKIDKLLAQNKEIAQGIIHVAEIIKQPQIKKPTIPRPLPPKQNPFLPPKQDPFPPPTFNTSRQAPQSFHEPIMPSRNQPNPFPTIPQSQQTPQPRMPNNNFGNNDFGLDIPSPPPNFNVDEDKKKKFHLFGKK